MKKTSQIIAIVSILFISVYALANTENIIIDSEMSFEQSVKGSPAPKEIIDALELLDVEYYSFDSKLHRGQLLVHKEVAEDLKIIFDLIKETKFIVNKAVPIVKYKWSDDASMADNNSSAFCYRFIAGTKRMSNHAQGRAVDINPRNNPVVYANGRISPKGANYIKGAEGAFDANHPVVKKFKELGWRWGGDFKSFKDYHHFDKK